MKTFAKICAICIFFGIWIAMACNHKWQHKYLGTVVSNEIIRKELPQENGLLYITYKFKYKSKVNGKIFNSSGIKSDCYNESGFITKENSWVEHQLLEKGQVYIPGWTIGYSIIFVIYTAAIGFFFIIHLLQIKCFPDSSFSNCSSCNCPALCPFNCSTLDDDVEEYEEHIAPALRHFFCYESKEK